MFGMTQLKVMTGFEVEDAELLNLFNHGTIPYLLNNLKSPLAKIY
jgi:hypothetical protein